MLTTAGLVSCSEDKSTSNASASTAISAKVKNPNTTSSLLSVEPASIENSNSVVIQPFFNATSSSSSLTSLKYIILSASLCQGVTVSGSAYTATSGCISLYDSGLSSTSIDSSNFANYSSKTIDLMSTSSLATFNTNADKKGAVTAGSYNYVVINWTPWIAATGSVTVNGTTIYTKSCTVDGTGLCVSGSSMASSPAAQALTKSANGGTWFKFQNPFVISDSDVSSQTEYAIDLVFNGTSAVAAVTNATPGSYGSVADTSAGVTGNSIYVPMINLTPLPRKASDTTSKETYNITTADAQATYRVELYYQKSDTNKTIYGVNAILVLNNSTSTSATTVDNGSKVASITTAANGSLALNGTDGSALVSGLVRRAGSTVTLSVFGGGSQTSTYAGTTDL